MRSWSAGSAELLHQESLGFVVAAMSLPNVLTRLKEHTTVIAPGDRYDVLPGLLLAHQSATFPNLSSIVLTGGYIPPASVQQLLDGVQSDLPILVTSGGTFETASTLAERPRPADGATRRPRSMPHCGCSPNRSTSMHSWRRSMSPSRTSSHR